MGQILLWSVLLLFVCVECDETIHDHGEELINFVLIMHTMIAGLTNKANEESTSSQTEEDVFFQVRDVVGWVGRILGDPLVESPVLVGTI